MFLGLLATAAAAQVAVMAVPPEHSVTATVLLLPPTQNPAPGEPRANPLLQLAGLAGPVDILARTLNDPATREEVASKYPGTEYTATRDASTSAPILVVTVQDRDLAKARDVRSELLRRTPKALDQLQTSLGVAQGNQITSTVIVEEGQAQVVTRPTLRTVIVAVVGGLILTVVLVSASNALRRRSSGRPASPLPSRRSTSTDDAGGMAAS